MELTAINVRNFSEELVAEILKTLGGGKYPPTMFIDLLGYADAFSKRMDMPHPKLLGRKFLLYVVEMRPQTKATAIFLLNNSAHEPQVISRIRGLFHNQLAYDKD